MSESQKQETIPQKQETIVTFDVPPGYREEARLDVYLTRLLQNASRMKVQRGIREGRVSVNGRVVEKTSHPVAPGDTIVCRILRPPPLEIVPEDLPLDIVYEDEDLIVLDKAAVMVVHPAYGNRTGTLVHALLHHVGSGVWQLESDEEDSTNDGTEEDDAPSPGLSTLNARPTREGDLAVRPGIVHRLDKDTSGLMVVAKNDTAHVHLARQFEHRTIRRLYLALVWGVPAPAQGTVETQLGRDRRDRKKMAVMRTGKRSVTHYRLVEAQAFTSLVEFRLETGRTHQIRVHARHLGHPVLGDPTYDGQSIGAGPKTARRRAFYKNLFTTMPRQGLHAYTLGFTHPVTGEELDFKSSLPADMQAVLERLRGVEPAP
jgi:23S rRNA pseudouridine1911/1915/1917 synthase